MRFVIPEGELRFRATRAGGPGGQHVNTSSTKIEVLWDVARSPSLTDEQKERLTQRLRNRMDRDGVLSVTAGARRSQLQNRVAAVERLHELVRGALRQTPPRKRTRPPKSAVESRLADKKKRADVKRMRKPVDND
jgi:ribosome-associated protein